MIEEFKRRIFGYLHYRDNSNNEVTLTQIGLSDKIVKDLVLHEAKFDITHTTAKYVETFQSNHLLSRIKKKKPTMKNVLHRKSWRTGAV